MCTLQKMLFFLINHIFVLHFLLSFLQMPALAAARVTCRYWNETLGFFQTRFSNKGSVSDLKIKAAPGRGWKPPRLEDDFPPQWNHFFFFLNNKQIFSNPSPDVKVLFFLHSENLECSLDLSIMTAHILAAVRSLLKDSLRNVS